MMRASRWSRSFLAEVWDRDDLIDHPWWENASLLEALGYRLDPAELVAPSPALEKVKLLDLAWNSVLVDRSPSPVINHHGGGRPVDEVRDALLDDAVTLRRGTRGTARLIPRVSGAVNANARTASNVVEAVRFREQLPYALNALGLRGRGAEVGVRKGEFSEWLLSHWQGAELVSIDPWHEADARGYRDIANASRDEHVRFRAETEGRLLRFGSRSSIWRLTSREAADRIESASLDFVYIDARHDEPSVSEDLELWWPKVVPGGILAGHDYIDGELAAGTFGVRSAVDRFAVERRTSVHVTTGDWPWPSWIMVTDP